MQDHYDIVIIGSGAGGAVVADKMAQHAKNGLKVLLLESGPYRTKEHFTQKEREMTGIYYKRGGFYSSNLSIGVAAANTVGGSTAVYTGVSFRPPKSVLNNWKNDLGFNFLTDEYTDKILTEIEEDLNIAELPIEEDNQNNRLFELGAKKLGIPIKRLKINLRNCKRQGFCNLGCTSGGKQSTLEVQLPRALALGVELVYNAEVFEVGKNSVSFQIKGAPKGSLPNKKKEGVYTINANTIVLACGVLHTPALLLKSLKSLGIDKGVIGRYVSLHPALNVNALYKENIVNYRGFPKTWYTDAFSDSDHYYLETSFYYPGITAKNNPGFGSLHREYMENYQKMMSILILTHDPSEGKNRIDIDKNKQAVLHYQVHPEVKASLVKAIKKSAEIFFAAGCTQMLMPGATKSPIVPSDMKNMEYLITENTLNFSKTPLSSAHPQGGAIMGIDPKTSVCDLDGKVWGTENIFIADASVFPTSVKVNPYLTVMMMATHISKQIENRFL